LTTFFFSKIRICQWTKISLINDIKSKLLLITAVPNFLKCDFTFYKVRVLHYNWYTLCISWSIFLQDVILTMAFLPLHSVVKSITFCTTIFHSSYFKIYDKMLIDIMKIAQRFTLTLRKLTPWKHFHS
jgi:hypothetical protein